MVMKGQVISVGGKKQEAEAKAERAESYPWFWMEPDNLGIFVYFTTRATNLALGYLRTSYLPRRYAIDQHEVVTHEMAK
jgi:hypothetical protein